MARSGCVARPAARVCRLRFGAVVMALIWGGLVGGVDIVNAAGGSVKPGPPDGDLRGPMVGHSEFQDALDALSNCYLGATVPKRRKGRLVSHGWVGCDYASGRAFGGALDEDRFRICVERRLTSGRRAKWAARCRSMAIELRNREYLTVANAQACPPPAEGDCPAPGDSRPAPAWYHYFGASGTVMSTRRCIDGAVYRTRVWMLRPNGEKTLGAQSPNRRPC